MDVLSLTMQVKRKFVGQAPKKFVILDIVFSMNHNNTKNDLIEQDKLKIK